MFELEVRWEGNQGRQGMVSQESESLPGLGGPPGGVVPARGSRCGRQEA